MNCSYCNKPAKILFLLHEDVPKAGPTRKEACFPCVQDLGEKTVRELRGMKVEAPPAPPV